MTHAFVTIVASVLLGDVSKVQSLIDALGNPASPAIAQALDGLGRIHFASLNIFPASSGRNAHLVLEFSGDGEQNELITDLDSRAGVSLKPIFQMAEGFSASSDLASFWRANAHAVGQGYFSTIGLTFTGTPGMTVKRILDERVLAQTVTRMIAGSNLQGSALDKLDSVRQTLRKQKQFDWVWQAESMPLVGQEGVLWKTIAGTLKSGIRSLLWPLLILPALVGVLLGFWWHRSWIEILAVLAVCSLILFFELLGVVYLVYRIRQSEDTDQPDYRNPDGDLVAQVMRRENLIAQNHLDVQTPLKPSRLHRLALRAVFFVIGQLCARQFKPGYLGSIGSIHFARWILVPGSDDLLFFSNYDGSWESYLEDFITKAHAGLTGVWSNTVGFPRSEFVFQKGATDGDRFKRWARARQIPTRFWYSAYPDLPTNSIRKNAAIRYGLAGALSESEAREWLSLFGSAPRPVGALETDEIQSLVFGAFSPLPESACILLRLATGDLRKAGEWLSEIGPQIAFGERVPEKTAIIVTFAASALVKFGLPKESISTFPNAFLEGMSAEWRSRLLGDISRNDPGQWWWGRRTDEFDGAILLYAQDASSLDEAFKSVENNLIRFGHSVVRRINNKSVPYKQVRTEPFGFVDGISQPIIRGTFRHQQDTPSIHLVAPGEFILGYPDNHGYLPPTPEVAATCDPENLLPVVPNPDGGSGDFPQPYGRVARDLGRNGSFIVIRQLEQDVPAFDNFINAAATQTHQPPNWIAARLVGRWKDGSSLVRNPSYSASIKATRHASQSPDPDNDFLFGVEDPQGLRCPLGAHIRRANPRESFDAGSADQLAITNRHRILRRGRPYAPQGNDQKPGLLFICLNADIERQFEFIQQTWMLNPNFHGLSGEADSLLAGDQSGHFTVPTPDGPICLAGLSAFVQMRGGAYFFLPGKRTLQFLARYATSYQVMR